LTSLEFTQGIKTTNYLANAVLNYFNEGGGRLYVLRVAQGASSAEYNLGADSANRVIIKSRFPGAIGNGRVTVREILSTATHKALETAPEGTLLRASGSDPVEPARITGTGTVKEPFTVHNSGRLRLLVRNSTEVQNDPDIINIDFFGKSTEATAQKALVANITLDNDSTLNVKLDDGDLQSIILESGSYTSAEFALAINVKIARWLCQIKQ
jgi:hypothetical protein